MKILRGDVVYVVELGYLVEERVATLCAGEVGLAVSFECYVDSARVHITDDSGVFWEMYTVIFDRIAER